jgi:sugar phosphate permease
VGLDKQNSKFRWVIFATVTVTYLLMSSQRTAPGLITDQLMVDFSVTAATIGLLASVQFLVYTCLQIPMGMWADRFGPYFFLITGAFLTGVGTIIYSLGTHAFILLLGRVLTGVGDATVWVNLVIIMGQWFNKREFVKLIGLAGMTGSLGFILATVPFSLWIDLLGWRAAFFQAGLLLCLCGVMLYIVLVKIPKQSIWMKKGVPSSDENTWAVLKRICSSPQAWAIFACHFGVVGAYVGFIGSWAVPFGMDLYGLSRSDASQLIMVGLIGALIGAPLSSFIASRLHMVKRPYIIVHITMLGCWSAFLLFHGNPPIAVAMALFFVIGLCYGACMLTFSLIHQTYPLSESGLVSGFANTGGFLSAVLLPGLFGMVLDHFQGAGSVDVGYHYGFFIPFIFSVIGLVGVVCIRERGQGHDGGE